MRKLTRLRGRTCGIIGEGMEAGSQKEQQENSSASHNHEAKQKT